MLIDFKKSVTFPFQDKCWINYMLIYSILCYIPVFVILLSIQYQAYVTLIVIRPFLGLLNLLEFIPLGYIIQSVHRELNNLPTENETCKQSFSEVFKTGANLFVISFLYSFLILFILIIYVSYFVINDYLSPTDLLAPTFWLQNEVILPIIIGLLIFVIFTLILIPYFFVSFAQNLELLDAFNWAKIFKRLGNSWKEFIISVVCILLVNALTIIVTVFLFIVSNSGLNAFFAATHIIPSQFGLWLWIIISGIIVISISAFSFVAFMVLYNIMAQVYKTKAQEEV